MEDIFYDYLCDFIANRMPKTITLRRNHYRVIWRKGRALSIYHKDKYNYTYDLRVVETGGKIKVDTLFFTFNAKEDSYEVINPLIEILEGLSYKILDTTPFKDHTIEKTYFIKTESLYELFEMK